MKKTSGAFRRAVVTAGLCALIALGLPVAAAQRTPGFFSKLEGFSTKTGFRGVFAFQAAQPVKAIVRYGKSPTALDQTVTAIPGAPDTAGMVVVDGLEEGATYWWQVEDVITGQKSAVSSFVAANAYTAWDGSTYTLDLVVQIDSESLDPQIPYDMAAQNAAAGVNIFAERLYDATDGFARLGNVIITDTETDHAGSIPFFPTAMCEKVPGAGGNLADVLIQTTVPFDSHTWAGWAISDPCTSFYVGRLGQLVVPWGIAEDEDLHFGFVATHEMMHYGFNAPDLYGGEDLTDPRSSGCWDLSWDGSLMHNTGGWNGRRWELTELDRNEDLTPCDHSHDDRYTWQELRQRYVHVPERPQGPIEHIIDTMARGNPDGGALDIKILDRTGPASTLTSFVPDDRNPPPVPEPDCSPSAPLATDATGDGTLGIGGSALDLTGGTARWYEGRVEVSIEVDDLGPENPLDAPNISFNLNFDHGPERLYVEGVRWADGLEEFTLGAFLGTPLFDPRVHLIPVQGKFDPQLDRVSITFSNADLLEIQSEPLEDGDRLSRINLVSRNAVPAGLTTVGLAPDSATATCDLVIGTGSAPLLPPPPPVEPPPDEVLSASDPVYSWEGSRSTNLEREPLLGLEVFGCEGFDGPGCDFRRLAIASEAVGGTFIVSIEGEQPNLNDFDLYVYDPKGKLVGSSSDIDTEPGIEQVSIELKRAGTYRVEVHARTTFHASYSGQAELKLAQAAAPAPAAGGSGAGGQQQPPPSRGQASPRSRSPAAPVPVSSPPVAPEDDARIEAADETGVTAATPAAKPSATSPVTLAAGIAAGIAMGSALGALIAKKILRLGG